MQTTFIVKNLTESTLESIAALSPLDAYLKLKDWAYGDLKHCVSIKHGTSNAFRDRVEWNGLVKGLKPMTFMLEPRRGYKLFTFTIQ
jgi:hypothetical protein